MRLGIAVLAVVTLAGPALAQHQHGQSPYAGMQQRPVKALSDQQLADLQAGRGMGLALAGELNGYPGPSHVLELADQLQLDDAQRQRVRQLYESMKAEAIPVGEKLIAQEAALDQAFARREILPATLTSLTAQIGETQGASKAPLRRTARLSLTRRASRSPHPEEPTEGRRLEGRGQALRVCRHPSRRPLRGLLRMRAVLAARRCDSARVARMERLVRHSSKSEGGSEIRGRCVRSRITLALHPGYVSLTGRARAAALDQQGKVKSLSRS
jgi:hypothetical protein